MQTSLRCSYQCGTCPVHKRNEAARVTFSGRGNGQRKEEENKQELGTTGQIYCSSPRICTTCKPAGDTGTDLLHLNGRAQDLLKDGCWRYRINPFGLLSHGHCVSSTIINLETWYLWTCPSCLLIPLTMSCVRFSLTDTRKLNFHVSVLRASTQNQVRVKCLKVKGTGRKEAVVDKCRRWIRTIKGR